MEINTKGIYEIRRIGNYIVLMYKTEKDSLNAYMKTWEEVDKEMKKMFPKGIFEEKK